MDDADLWFAPIRRQRHADVRIAERLDLPESDVGLVVGEIRVGLVLGRYAFSTPRWCGGRSDLQPDGHIYVWDESISRCYVLGRAERTLFLVTVLLELGQWSARTERQRSVRTGSVRA